MPKLTVADLTAAEATTFDLAGHTYTVQTLTRDVQIKHDAAAKKFRESDDDESTDKQIDLLAKCIETLFDKPEGAPAMSKALSDGWKSGELGLGLLYALWDKAQEAAFARPTSRRTN